MFLPVRTFATVEAAAVFAISCKSVGASEDGQATAILN